MSKIESKTLEPRFALAMLNSGKFSDCSFLVGEGKELFKCHKNLLSAASPVFEAMLYGSLKEKCDNAIQLPDIDPTAFRIFLEYIYGDKANGLTNENALQVFKRLWYIAEKYMVPTFREYCEEFIMSLTTERDSNSSCTISIFDCACMSNDTKLMEFCEKRIKKNEKFFFDTDEILKIKIKTLERVIECALANYDKSNRAGKNQSLFSQIFQKIDEYASVNNLFESNCCSGECCLSRTYDSSENESENEIDSEKNSVDDKSGRKQIKEKKKKKHYEYEKIDIETNPQKDEFRELFEKLLNDQRIGKQEFYWGPAQSRLLCKKEEGFKLLMKRYSDCVAVSQSYNPHRTFWED